MKTVFKHIINLIITIVICIPCFLFFDWVGQKSIILVVRRQSIDIRLRLATEPYVEYFIDNLQHHK